MKDEQNLSLILNFKFHRINKIENCFNTNGYLQTYEENMVVKQFVSMIGYREKIFDLIVLLKKKSNLI